MNLVALSQDGSMMSTAEVRLPEEGIGGLVCLKFWALGSENKKFTLSTVIYEPHRFGLGLFTWKILKILYGLMILNKSPCCCFSTF